MQSLDTDKVFSGSIPKLYETYLVPLIFEPYAADLANRRASRPLARILEIAAGTGVVTCSLASVLPESVSIVATDLNQPMLDHAAALGTKRPVEWRQADAMQLPFRDGTFDAVVCQFLRNEIEGRDAARLGEATDIAADAIAKRFGPGAIDGKIQAHIVSIGT